MFPRWRGDGRELFYMSQATGGKIVAVETMADSATFGFLAPKALFDSPYVSFPHVSVYHTFAVSRDGQRFLIPHQVAKGKSEGQSLPVTVVLNWTAAMKQ
jgi:hypothetical protein